MRKMELNAIAVISMEHDRDVIVFYFIFSVFFLLIFIFGLKYEFNGMSIKSIIFYENNPLF